MRYHLLLPQNSFVPDLQNEEDDVETATRKWNYRIKHWEEVVKQQFQLAYYGRVSYEESQEMSIHEREYMFGLLIEQKSAENKAKEEAIKAASNATRAHK